MSMRVGWAKGGQAGVHLATCHGHNNRRCVQSSSSRNARRSRASTVSLVLCTTKQDEKPKNTELAEVLKLALPALAVVLSDPLQTLIDSACVGHRSTIQLAALGPNTAVFNSVAQLFAFLGIATANVIATNSLTTPGLTQSEISSRRCSAEAALCNAVVLASVLGIAVALTMRLQGPTWLASMGTDAAVLPLAIDYLSVRALGTPAVLVMTACQGACLGQQDTVTPMWVCLGATTLNLVGDIALVWGADMGVVGAALATAGAQVCAAAYFIWRLRNNKNDNSGGIRLRLRWTGLPQFKSMRSFLEVAVTLVARTAVGMVAYFSMAVTATGLGLIATAAHQVAMQSFWFISFFPEPLSMAAQTLLARHRARPDIARSKAILLVRAGLVLGLGLAVCVGGMFMFGGRLFTSDAAVLASVRELAPYGALAMAICGLLMLIDGISIGSGSFKHLPVSVGAGMAATLGALWAGRMAGAGLKAVWWALCAFYGVRLLGHGVFYAATWPNNVFGAGRGSKEQEQDESGGGDGGDVMAPAAS